MRLQVSVHTAVVPKLYRGNIFPIQYRGKRFLMDFRKFPVMVEQVVHSNQGKYGIRIFFGKPGISINTGIA
jgi:hypothetical protein